MTSVRGKPCRPDGLCRQRHVIVRYRVVTIGARSAIFLWENARDTDGTAVQYNKIVFASECVDLSLIWKMLGWGQSRDTHAWTRVRSDDPMQPETGTSGFSCTGMEPAIRADAGVFKIPTCGAPLMRRGAQVPAETQQATRGRHETISRGHALQWEGDEWGRWRRGVDSGQHGGGHAGHSGHRLSLESLLRRRLLSRGT